MVDTMNNIFGRHRIHVMDDESVVDLVPLNPKVAPHVSRYDLVAELTPLAGRVEPLVEITIEPEGRSTDFAP